MLNKFFFLKNTFILRILTKHLVGAFQGCRFVHHALSVLKELAAMKEVKITNKIKGEKRYREINRVLVIFAGQGTI